MTPEPVEALVERVREGAHFYMAHTYREPPGEDVAHHVPEGCKGCAAEAALTELAERVKAAEARDCEKANDLVNAGLHAAELRARAEAAERLATENGRLAQTHWDRAEAAERERDLAHVAIGEHEETYMRMEAFFRAQRDELVEALERVAAAPMASNEHHKIADAALAKVRGIRPDSSPASEPDA